VKILKEFYHRFMTDTPFLDKTKELAQSMGYIDMQVRSESDKAMSHAWWRRLVQDGPWGEGAGTGRVNPPGPERLDGIAKLFGTTPNRVAQMIAADWYGVQTAVGVSDRVLNLSHLIDALDDQDASLVESLLRRLSGRHQTVEVKAEP
jgi:hypothetical protein